MGFFRNLNILLLAALIANPLCCCFAQPIVGVEEEVHSCCSRNAPADDESPADDPCTGCQTKNPRVADGGKTLPITVEFFELPVFARKSSDSLPSFQEFDFPALVVISEPPPPRLVLALQQRFLI